MLTTLYKMPKLELPELKKQNLKCSTKMMADNSVNSWSSELGMEDPFLSDQCGIMDFLDEELPAVFGEDFQPSLSPNGNSLSPILIPTSSSTSTLFAFPTMEAPSFAVHERPTKQNKPNPYNSWTTQNMPNLDKDAPTPMILSFGNPNLQEMNPQQVNIGTSNPDDDAVPEVLTSQVSFGNLEQAAAKSPKPTKKTGDRIRPASQTYDHIIAERKRREQLSQRFVALSVMVPGLKKDRVKMLKEQATKQSMESVVLVKKSQLFAEDEGSSDESGSPDGQPLPEIEAKVCDKSVLLRVHCEKNKGVLVNILSEVEKLNLAVTNASVAPFGSLALDITIIVEMEKEFNLTMVELVKSLRSAILRSSQAD